MTSLTEKVTAAVVNEDLRETETSSGSGRGATAGLTYWAANNLTWAAAKLLSFLDGSKFAGKSPYLTGNYAPVRSETFSADLIILEGTLPSDLNGAFIRTGPNPYFDPVARYHWFDGDGMTHAVRIKNASASYCNKFVDTERLQQEKAAGYAVGGKFGDARGISGVFHIMLDILKKRLGIVSTANGFGSANTALAYHAGRLLALHEGDLPYHLQIACNGLTETVSRITFGGAFDKSRPEVFTAHPKIDPKTGEMFGFAYSVEKAPYLWFTRVDAKGAVAADFPVPGLRGPIMMHDFALTERHVIFIDAPLFFKPENIIKKGTLPFEFQKTAALRLGVMDRYATSADEDTVKWFDIGPGMCFHVANAWEISPSSGSDPTPEIEVYLCTFKDFSLEEFTAVSEDSEPHLTRVKLNLATGEAITQQLLDLAGDFPVVPATKVGRKTQYSYVATFETSSFGSPVFYGVAKVDLAAESSVNSVKGLIRHGDGRIGGECYFAPREDAVDEDDGYLMTYIYDEARKESEFVVYDAKTMSSKPLVRVSLGQRVPFGFHCLWMTEEQVQKQRN